MQPVKAAIIAATREAVLEAGFAALSTRNVARRAEVPLSQIHYHFGSKENLVLEMFAAENARLLERQAALYAGDEPLSTQWERACNYLDEDIRSGYVRILAELIAAGYARPEIGARVSELLDDWVEVLEAAFTHHVERGLDLGLSPRHLAALTGAVFLGAESVVLVGHESDHVPTREALRAVGDLIEAAEWRAATGTATFTKE